MDEQVMPTLQELKKFCSRWKIELPQKGESVEGVMNRISHDYRFIGDDIEREDVEFLSRFPVTPEIVMLRNRRKAKKIKLKEIM